MLSIYVGDRNETIYDPPSYFDVLFNEDWMKDPLVKEMIKDVDNSELVGPNLIQSPVLGPISPRAISGGVKTLILLLCDDSGRKFNITSCGDNCSKWICKIAELKDIEVDLEYLMKMPDDIHAIILNTGKEVSSYREYLLAYTEALYGDKS